MRKLFGIPLVFMVLYALPSPARSNTDLASSYPLVRRSLALVVYTEGKTLVTGSAFCVGSEDGFSFLLTNAHVVGSQKKVAVFVAGEKNKPYIGLVFRVNPELDLAVVVIKDSVPPLHLGRDRLSEGESVGIAGYPSSNIDFAFAGLGLSPSVHAGTLNSYEAQGGIMVFDAQVEHGNSGGPIFDPSTGIVYGVVIAKYGSDQTNLGEAIDMTFSFLQNTGVPIVGRSRDQVVSQESASAQGTAGEEVSPADSVASASTHFQTYIPLSRREQHYTCSRNVTATMSIRPVGDSYGDALVVMTFDGLSGATPSVSIQRHDESGNIVLVGYVDAQSKPHQFSEQAVAVPLTPADGWSTALPTANGAEVPRTWIGNSMLKAAAGTYNVQIYQDQTEDGGTFSSAYADRVGLVGMLYQNKLGKSQIACTLSNVVTH